MTTRTDRRGQGFFDEKKSGLTERVVNIRRVAKVVKGGRHLTFSALVVVGDNQGRVGSGLGKAVAIPDAVRKGVTIAEKTLITVPLNGTTIPHQVEAKYGAAKVLVKPAPPGTGIKSGPSMRVVLDMVGAKDIVAKSLRSQNPINVVRATIEALSQLEKMPGQTDSATVAVAIDESQESPAQEESVAVAIDEPQESPAQGESVAVAIDESQESPAQEESVAVQELNEEGEGSE